MTPAEPPVQIPHLLLEVSNLAWVILSLFFLVLFAQEAYHEEGWSIVVIGTTGLIALYVAMVFTFGWDWVATILRRAGRTSAAESLMKDSLAGWVRLTGAAGFGAAVKRGNLADFFAEQGRFDEAESLYKQILKRWTQPGLHLFSPACGSLSRYASYLTDQHRAEEASAVRRLISGWQVASVCRQAAVSAVILLVIAYLASTAALTRAIQSSLSGEVKYPARTMVFDLARIKGAVFGRDAAARVFLEYGIKMGADGGDPGDAEWALTNAAILMQSHAGSGKYGARLCEALGRLGAISLCRGDLKQAETFYAEAVRFSQAPAKWGQEEGEYAVGISRVEALMGLARTLEADDRFQDSREYFREALQLATKLYGETSETVIEARAGLARAFRREGDLSRGLAQSVLAVDAAEKIFADHVAGGGASRQDFVQLAQSLVLKADLLRLMGKDEAAAAVSRRIDEIQSSRYHNLILSRSEQGRIARAMQDITKWLLSIKYSSSEVSLAQKELSRVLQGNARHHQKQLEAEAARSKSPAGKLEYSISELCVRSPNESGMLTVEVRGQARTSGSIPELFGYLYLVRPPKPDQEIKVEDLSEITFAPSRD